MRWWFPVSLRAVARTEPGRDPFPASGAACWVILCQQGFTMDPATVSTSSSCNCTLFPAVLLVMALLMAAHKLGLLCQLWHKVEPKSPRHGGELVAEVLKAHRVRYLFTLVGGHISPILVASEKLGIRVVDTRHEATAVFAADAVARLSGTVGVAAVTAGPGVTNTITAVKNAQMAESPVLLIGGAASRLQKGRGALQDIDQMSLLRPLCKFCASVQTVREIVPVLRRAIATAQSDTPGPVFVEFPVDVLYPYHLVEKELTPKGSPKTFIAKAMSWYQHNFLRNLFAGAWETQDLFPLPVHVPQATAKQVQQCVELVSRAKKPIILLGSQVTLPPTPVKELRAALEDLAIPCFLGGMARGMLGRDSPLHIHQNRREALKEADVVILAGSVCDFRLSYGRVLSRYSKIIAVNRNRSQLLLNSDIFWKPQVAIQGDASSFLLCLSRGLKGYSCPQDWAASLKDNDHQKEKANREKAEKPTEQHLNPLKVLHRMDALLPENSLLVLDGGDFVGSAAYIVQPPGPLCWLDPGAFGTLGVGGGFALGAKLCRPDSEVWILYGDGSLGYSILEFDTFVRHKTPVIALVGNDACWSQIAREQVPMLGSNVACGLAYLDYHTVAEGLGGRGFLLTRQDEGNLDNMLRAAREQCIQGHPVLINALIGRTNFRDGSISM
ncbi:2-hydroxyacyl-CoA lyase 2 isoform X2 [Alligator mississippiensis]|uniref:2-hydroxyacyl-CoA lyase 2 n=1 Tax=Alligator mississippiensis TaxID=8496 RepID=A0A151NV25_ALLMI|nr:2-hydroxyacyl-CoA lyase 2 isoform X2 [Alligator mississippiensis]KYO40771.1 acetolactate synthase-like protein [Alligator mississippiensis]